MPFKDRTNIKYGKLTAIEYLGKSMWRCKCECGNETVVYGGHLESGHTKSCGCYRSPRQNLIGQKFGKLTVQKWDGNGKWLCLCECGNITLVQTDNLKNGNTKSCGCYQKEQTSKATFKDLTGQRFGKLTVLERVENNRFSHVNYKCQCDCGSITIVDATNLRNGNTNSCGCIKSKGEMIINNWLKNHNINYQTQYSLDKIVLNSGRRPFFDFAIFDNNKKLLCLIEYDGKQHFEASNYGWNTEENLKKTQDRDKQKNELCKKNNIKLYRIAYKDNIENKLNEIVEELNNGTI